MAPKRVADKAAGNLLKKRYAQKFKDSYTAKYPCVIASKKGTGYAFCTICVSDFSIEHGGINDCGNHVDGPRHEQNAKMKKSQPSMLTMLKVTTDEQKDLQDKITAAELVFADFIAEHDISLATADHASKLFQAMFPDSKIAKGFRCARTKTTALVKFKAKEISNNIAKSAENAFSLSTDGSNERSEKLYPIVIHHLDSQNMVKSSLLSVVNIEEPECSGINICKALCNELE